MRINRGDDFDAKVQNVNQSLSEMRTRENVKYIDKENIGLGMLNRNKLHLNRFGTNQVLKNYREILKIWHYKGKPANESVSILKPVGSSSPFKTVKNPKISDKYLNTIQKDPMIPYESWNCKTLLKLC